MKALAVIIAVTILGLPGIGSAFTCPLVKTVQASEKHCVNCPGEKDAPCPAPASDCLLLCPYTAERTAVTSRESFDRPVNTGLDRDLSVILPLAGRPAFASPFPLNVHSAPLFLLNRVLRV
jgi:hypothetical protein